MKRMLFPILMLFLLVACEKDQVAPIENDEPITTTVDLGDDNSELVKKVDLLIENVENPDLPLSTKQNILVRLRNIKNKLESGQTEEPLAMLEYLIAYIEELVDESTINDTEEIRTLLYYMEWVRCEMAPECENGLLLEVWIDAPDGGYTLYVHPYDQRTGWNGTTHVNGVEWGPYSLTNASSLWDGKANTDTILATVSATYKDGNFAAKVCDDLNGNGPKVWYLPAKEELNAIHNKFGNTSRKREQYNFKGYYYWSSSEAYIAMAWHQHFYDGAQKYDRKFEFYDIPPDNSCRCVRR
jgi:hypothetical protein